MEEEEMVWCKDKRQEKDLYKLWNRRNGVHPSIDKIWGCKKKLKRVLTNKQVFYSIWQKVLTRLKKVAYIQEGSLS